MVICSSVLLKMSNAKPMLRIPFQRLSIGTVSLPLGAFVVCIILSFVFHFERSTFTHCKVWNFAPSISSAIGVLKPQCYIWRLAIALHCAPRFLMALIYFKRLASSLENRLKSISLAFWLNVTENVALLVLSFAPSKEDFRLHQVAFVAFIVCSQAYMLLSYRLWSQVKDRDPTGHSFKASMLKLNFGFIVTALYWYYRHNTYCEPVVYSLFCICEYGIVLTNIGYHFAAFYDFGNKYLIIN